MPSIHRPRSSSHKSRRRSSRPTGRSRQRVSSSSNPVTARLNDSAQARVPAKNLKKPFAEGGFRKAAKGTYTSGPREGQTCVVKWFKPNVNVNSSNAYFQLDLKAVEKSIQIISKFNKLQLSDYTVSMCRGEVWNVGSSTSWSGKRVLVEPFIRGYKKFNSNSFHVALSPTRGMSDGHGVFERCVHTQGYMQDKDDPGKLMQALSHFSYHDSKREYLLCDLQGGVHGTTVVLTDPVILSQKRSYGITDLGQKGMETFFHRHRCNRYCSSKWRTPGKTTQGVPTRTGTTMR